MNDWQIVTAAEPWIVPFAKEAIVRSVERPFRPSQSFASMFPALTELLCRARLSEVTRPSGKHVLFAWGGTEAEVRAWLAPVAPATNPNTAAPDHQVLLTCFGGIAERFNEPNNNWLLNHVVALTVAEVHRDAGFLTDYAWAFEECGGIPISLAAFYPVAWEANGNCVLCSRETGALLFFAPDQADPDLIPFDRCPMYTLHTRPGAGSLRAWVERIAAQWLSHISE